MRDMVPIARIGKPRGYRGGFWVEPYREDLAVLLNSGQVWAGSGDRSGPYRVSEYFRYAKGSVLTLGGIDDREAAEALVGREILVDASLVPKENEAAFDTLEVVGWQVVDEARGVLGEVEGVRRGSAYWLFDVKTERGGAEIPAVTGLNVSVCREEHLIRVRLPFGYPGVDNEANLP